MSYAGRMNHLLRALQQGGFFPKEAELPGCLNIQAEISLKNFLSSKKSLAVRRVINAFRTIQADSFVKRGIKSIDFITPEVRVATEEFIEKHRAPLECSNVSEMEMIHPWELTG